MHKSRVSQTILTILLSLGSLSSQKLLYWPGCHDARLAPLLPENMKKQELALGVADARYKNLNVNNLNKLAERDISRVRAILRGVDPVELREFLRSLRIGEIILLPEFCQNLYLLWDRNMATEVFYFARLPAVDYMLEFEDLYKLPVSIFSKTSLASKSDVRISLISREFCVLSVERGVEGKICSDFLFEDLESEFEVKLSQSIFPEVEGFTGLLDLGDGLDWRVLDIGESGLVRVKLWGSNSCLETEGSGVLRKRVLVRECVAEGEQQGFWMASELDL